MNTTSTNDETIIKFHIAISSGPLFIFLLVYYTQISKQVQATGFHIRPSLVSRARPIGHWSGQIFAFVFCYILFRGKGQIRISSTMATMQCKLCWHYVLLLDRYNLLCNRWVNLICGVLLLAAITCTGCAQIIYCGRIPKEAETEAGGGGKSYNVFYLSHKCTSRKSLGIRRGRRKKNASLKRHKTEWRMRFGTREMPEAVF